MKVQRVAIDYESRAELPHNFLSKTNVNDVFGVNLLRTLTGKIFLPVSYRFSGE